MTIAFVLGNGTSRQGISLPLLANHGSIYGCNALYLEYAPSVLVATDKPIATRIQESGYSAKNKFYTRKPILGLGGYSIPEAYHGYSSGPAATGIAALDGNQQIYLLGFDMGPSKDNLINNIYAGQEFYKLPTAAPIYAGNWIKQLCKIATDFPAVTFIRVCGATTAQIPELEALKNVQHCNLATLLDRINKQEDL
jgi:hypothetical protein